MIGCETEIRALLIDQTFRGFCHSIQIDQMILFSPYIPRQEEELELLLTPPQSGFAILERPFKARVSVLWCNEIEAERCYEIGVKIVKVLA